MPILFTKTESIIYAKNEVSPAFLILNDFLYFRQENVLETIAFGCVLEYDLYSDISEDDKIVINELYERVKNDCSRYDVSYISSIIMQPNITTCIQNHIIHSNVVQHNWVINMTNILKQALQRRVENEGI